MAQTRPSRSELAYEHLLQEILRGRFQPGETLSIYALGEELEISRTPVIEALKRLEAEGLVEIMPQVGCRVIRLSAFDVAETFSLCRVLDALVAEAAAKVIDPRGLTDLRRLAEDVEAAAAREAKAEYDDLNYAFHDAIIGASQSPRVMRAARSAWLLLRFQLSILPSPPGAMAASLAEHRDIVDAIERRSGAKARAAAERHASKAAARVVAQLNRDATDRTQPGPARSGI
ncbi:MAG: narR1 [Conexibacter sp.]|nr:narR1 [Conexibacter sp.]